MNRASEEKLRERTILKAKRRSPPPKASKDVLSNRKIYKAKRCVGNKPTTVTPNAPHPNASTPPMHSPGPTPTATGPANNGGIESRSVETVLKTRAKLFSKVGTSWKRKAAGTLTCYRTANKQMLKLLNEKDSAVGIDLDVDRLLEVGKVIKESDKGKATYVRFNYDKGDERFLLQVKPEMLEQLYSLMTLKSA